MKKNILLAVFALVAIAAAHAQTNEQDSIQLAAEAEQQAYKDSMAAALDYQYATQKITLMADAVVSLDTLKYRPIVIADDNNVFYATIGQYAVAFQQFQGRMWNKQREEVRLNLIKGLPPEISFRNVKTDVAVDPATIK
ncbi:hypothetical protein [uncultured Draconibacterium sp.]|uniref:hypothetical protein n=1 Tax=uncultured Draconibacterium sp. TaxID=1573823 RepID=UPI0029C754C6|nr:hypothetical protein [uncultured Draconibacterium sp.]